MEEDISSGDLNILFEVLWKVRETVQHTSIELSKEVYRRSPLRSIASLTLIHADSSWILSSANHHLQ